MRREKSARYLPDRPPALVPLPLTRVRADKKLVQKTERKFRNMYEQLKEHEAAVRRREAARSRPCERSRRRRALTIGSATPSGQKRPRDEADLPAPAAAPEAAAV